MIAPIPWKVEPTKSDYERHTMDRTISATTHAGNPIWVCRVYNQVGSNVDDDAEFIVRAVNCHVDLLEALESVYVDHLERVAAYGNLETQPHRLLVMANARAAIAKAKGV